MPYKPEGYTSVSPYLLVSDAVRTLAFLKEVFGAEPLRIIPREGGTGIKHAEARLGDSVVMLGEVPSAPGCHVHVYAEDAEAAFARAVAAGAAVIQPLAPQDDGDHRGGVDDGNGVTWWIARQP